LDKLNSLFLGLVDDLGLGRSSLVVGGQWLLVENLDRFRGVGRLLGQLGTRHDNSLERIEP